MCLSLGLAEVEHPLDLPRAANDPHASAEPHWPSVPYEPGHAGPPNVAALDAALPSGLDE
jgi:hypothetical protein